MTAEPEDRTKLHSTSLDPEGLAERILDLSRPDRLEVEGLLDGHRLLEQLRKQLKAAYKRQKKILIGPWLSEVGFELLYWIPFLKWLCEKEWLEVEHCVVLSRGGCQKWYEHLGADYLDIFELMTAKTFRELNEERVRERGGRKHLEESDLDHRLRKKAQRQLEQACVFLHPQFLYRLFQPFWKGKLGLRFAQERLSYQPIQGVGQGSLSALGLEPGSYITVKFYQGSAFESRDVQGLEERIQRFAAGRTIVYLDLPFSVDDHESTSSMQGIQASSILEPLTNLGCQTELIAHASAHLGTYGGFSYLASLCGTEHYACYSKVEATHSAHFQLARNCFSGSPWGSFIPVDLKSAF